MNVKEITKPPRNTKTPVTEPYPALALWQRRGGRDRGPLWVASCWEKAAMDAGDNVARERHCQVEAIQSLLFGKSVGDPPGKRYPNVKLNREWQRRYADRSGEIQLGGLAA